MLLKQAQELALLQPRLVLLQFLQQRILLGLRLEPGGLLGLDGPGGPLGLDVALLGVLQGQLDGRSGAEADGRQDAAETGPAARPHLVTEGRAAHGHDVAFSDLRSESSQGR